MTDTEGRKALEAAEDEFFRQISRNDDTSMRQATVAIIKAYLANLPGWRMVLLADLDDYSSDRACKRQPPGIEDSSE